MSAQEQASGAAGFRPVVVVTLDREYESVVKHPREWREIWDDLGPFAVIRAKYARHDPKHPRPPSRHWLAIGKPDADLAELAGRLQKLPRVAQAQPRIPAPDPVSAVIPTDDPEFERQRHLEGVVPSIWESNYEGCARDGHGTNAWLAWRYPGGDGDGVTFVDVERGWYHEHEDLQDVPKLLDTDSDGTLDELIHGVMYDASRPHGTMVVGVVCARDNELGGVGIAPRTNPVFLSSTAEQAEGLIAALLAFLSDVADDLGFGSIEDMLEEISIDVSPETVAGALDAARERIVSEVPSVAAPDGSPARAALVLLEAQTRLTDGGPLLPAEVHDDVRAEIQALTEAGIAVVAVAGNGGSDLDVVANGLEDSGSIMVGGVEQMAPHRRAPDSNHGSRINCWCWADGVVTTSAEPSGESFRGTYQSLTGTSGAAAMLAGVAVTVQGMHYAEHGRALTPGELRELLKSTKTPPEFSGSVCTECAGSDDDAYEILPNLRKIIESSPLSLSYAWIRSHRGDEGEPSPPRWFRRELWIERHGRQPGSLATGLAGPATLTRFYARVSNRGPGEARATRIALHSGPLATRASPWSWTYHGDLHVRYIAAGSSGQAFLTVPGLIDWTSRSLAGVVAIGGRIPMTSAQLSDAHALIWMQEQMRAVTVRQVGLYREDAVLTARFGRPTALLMFHIAGHAHRNEYAQLVVWAGGSLTGQRLRLIADPESVRYLAGKIEGQIELGDRMVAGATLLGETSPIMVRKRQLLPVALALDLPTQPDLQRDRIRVVHFSRGGAVGGVEFRPESAYR